MSEKLYACLLYLYPTVFRAAYGEDALQLFRDRHREETGWYRRTRLWLDIFFDLAISLPRLHTSPRTDKATVAVASAAAAPIFSVLEDARPGAAAIVSGGVLTLAAFSLTVVLLNHAARHYSWHSAEGEAATRQAEFRPSKWLTPWDAKADGSSTSNGVVAQAATFKFAAGIDAPGQAARVVAQARNGFVNGAAMNAEHQRVLDAVIAHVKQDYFDPAVASEIGSALVAHQLRGDDAVIADEDFAALLTRQMREVSHDMHLEVVYSATTLPQPSPQAFSHMLTSLQKDNCLFRKVQMFPHRVGYLKLDAFLSPTVCGQTATAAMASLNDAGAVIFDLRDNRGGTSEMVSHISSYLFDHPEYMFDPRRVPTPQSWTASPVAGSKLADKPVYILTSSSTISAAEQFTYDLKMLKRARVIGEVTAGGAHAGVWHRIDDHYGVAIPENRAVNPYGQADWEATGIQPDIKVPAGAAPETALREAQSRTK